MIICNAIRTPDGTVLRSFSRHDCVSHKDANGNTYAVDGGVSYIRRVGSMDFTELSVDSKDVSHEVARTLMVWGTRGKGGKDPLKYVPIAELDTDHIEAILATQWQISEELKQLFNNELEYRKILND